MDDCVTAINNYLKDNDRIEKEYQAARDSVVKENKRITDKNDEDLKAYSARRAAYKTLQQKERKNDIGNLSGCGSLTDASDKWVLDSYSQDNVFSKYSCWYKYSDVHINRLMSVWDDENKFVPVAIQPVPVKSPTSLNINCCTNKINLANADQAKFELQNVKQKCDQTLSNGDGDSNKKDPEVIETPKTDTSNDENENKNKLKIIIIIIICIIFISGMGLTAYFIYNNSKKKVRRF